jgi:hypothetical protein
MFAWYRQSLLLLLLRIAPGWPSWLITQRPGNQAPWRMPPSARTCGQASTSKDSGWMGTRGPAHQVTGQQSLDVRHMLL